MLLRTTLLLLLISAIPASVSAECINSFLSCIGGVNSGFSSADATGELNCSRFHVESVSSFDQIQGLTSAQSVSVPGNTASAHLSDMYILTGPPAGTVVPITVVGDFELQNIRQVNAVTWSGSEIFTPLIAGAPDPSYVEYYFTAAAPGTETTTHQLRLDMNVKAGQAYEIELMASVFSSGNAGGYSHGRLSFEGLPPGSSITGCKGYHQDQPVPALARSWGALKAIYR